MSNDGKRNRSESSEDLREVVRREAAILAQHPEAEIDAWMESMYAGVSDDASSAAPWPLLPGVKTLRVNGYPMAYVEQGTGIPVVLVHGTNGDYRSWTHQMEPLGAKYRAISVSLRHYYPEPWDGAGEFSARQHVDDVIALIEGLNAGRAFLIGHSRGGHVSMHVALRRPDLLRGLVLVEPGLPPAALLPGSPDGERFASVRSERTRRLTELVNAGKIDEAVELFVDAISGPGTYKARSQAANQMTRDNIRTALGETRDTREPVTRERAATLKLPCLLIGGDKSPPRFAPVLGALETSIPGARLIVIPDAGHTMYRTHAAEFNELLLTFMAAH
jgi:pimeloyl-ACP methyl ester carboxylesterase